MKSEKKFPLFVISDCSNVFDQDILKILLQKEKPYLMLNGNEFCNIYSNPKFYRQAWLAHCRDLAEQSERPVAFCAAIKPDMIESFGNCGFGEIYWLAIVGDEKTVLNRLRQADVTNQDWIKSALLSVAWLKENAVSAYPQMTCLDMTELSPEDAADFVDQWICERINP